MSNASIEAGLLGGYQPANHSEVDALLSRISSLMGQAGISAEESTGGGDKSNHGRKRRPFGHVKAVLQRSQLSTAEVRALHGIFKKLEAIEGEVVS